MVNSKKDFNLVIIFISRLIKNGGESESSRLEQRSVIKFWWLRRAKHVKFTEGCMMCTVKYVVELKCLRIGQRRVSHYELESKRQFMKWRIIDFHVKKRFRMLQLVKKVTLAVFWT